MFITQPSDQALHKNRLANMRIGLYNTLPCDIPFVEHFQRNEITFDVLDPSRPLPLDYIIRNRIMFVLAHTPHRISKTVDYLAIRVIYVDVQELTEADVQHIIEHQLLFPRPDDSDANYRYNSGRK